MTDNALVELSRRSGLGVRRLALLLGVAEATVGRFKRHPDRMPKTLVRQVDAFLALTDSDLQLVTTFLTQGSTP